ncbi:MAG TPA: thioredoxin TrxC [Syntrophales bacterium]|nr:thioredoxin TrxC [Syntrophales bacterium]HOM06210.1 thioredoxin TrxC [Syntrophales bacterium]HOO00721.1 thioredoxin TrxC [Syntrophales bacterium]HPC00176.1 thioredoxin TrxC [Syntrophales bacterium]HPQ05808.1 thioredoxin TrxC [Syntrophales bacterium]
MDKDHLIVRCAHCGTKNRIPKERINDRPTCGKCGAALDEIIIRCLHCGTKNRVPEKRPHDRPLCGKCGSPLVVTGDKGEPLEVTDASFLREVLQEPGAVLVDFWAPWCAPCRTVAPVIEELAARYVGGVKFVKINVDENPVTASRYDIRSIPTMLLFRGGELRDRLVGALPAEEIEEHLLTLIKTN